MKVLNKLVTHTYTTLGATEKLFPNSILQIFLKLKSLHYTKLTLWRADWSMLSWPLYWWDSIPGAAEPYDETPEYKLGHGIIWSQQQYHVHII